MIKVLIIIITILSVCTVQIFSQNYPFVTKKEKEDYANKVNVNNHRERIKKELKGKNNEFETVNKLINEYTNMQIKFGNDLMSFIKTSPITSDNADIIESIEKIKTSLNNKTTFNKEEIDSMLEDLKALTEQISEIFKDKKLKSQTMDTINEINSMIKDDISKLQKKAEAISKDITDLKNNLKEENDQLSISSVQDKTIPSLNGSLDTKSNPAGNFKYKGQWLLSDRFILCYSVDTTISNTIEVEDNDKSNFISFILNPLEKGSSLSTNLLWKIVPTTPQVATDSSLSIEESPSLFFGVAANAIVTNWKNEEKKEVSGGLIKIAPTLTLAPAATFDWALEFSFFWKILIGDLGQSLEDDFRNDLINTKETVFYGFDITYSGLVLENYRPYIKLVVTLGPEDESNPSEPKPIKGLNGAYLIFGTEVYLSDN